MKEARRRTGLAVAIGTLLSLAVGASAQDRVSQTVHNLSAAGPGTVRASTETQVCIFCHAPHNTGGSRPLWNRGASLASYQIYQSSTLDAQTGQPTGASKFCLSCHDGTVALGSVLSRTERIRMAGSDYIPAGLSHLGTDLSDDHPISFFYTSGLAASDHQLVNPVALQADVELDDTGQLQCTSCHDPHHNTFGKFLVMSNEFGALCTACHVMNGWASGSHRSSSAVVSGAASGDWPYATVAQNACRSCHRPHTAGGHHRLLIHQNEEDNCLSCHDGLVAQTNILAQLDRFSAHDPRSYVGLHDPVEVTTGSPPHVECVDCHNPHAASPQDVVPGYIAIGATLAEVPGVTIGGTDVATANYEYEVCFRCHGDSPVPVPRRVRRQADVPNLRLSFSTGNPSYHPVVQSSPSPDTVSLVPGYTRGSLIRCTDCHNNDAGPAAGGSGPNGPHGSNNSFLLERNYTVQDGTPESASAYALCYKCHERTSILSDQSFEEHRKHIEGEDTPCAICHDPHGVSTTLGLGLDRTHLINFDVRVVLPNPDNGLRIFEDLGTHAGSCTLICHGEKHNDERYGN